MDTRYTTKYMHQAIAATNTPTLAAIVRRTPGTQRALERNAKWQDPEEVISEALNELEGRALGKRKWQRFEEDRDDPADRFHTRWDEYKAEDQAAEDRFMAPLRQD